MSGNPMRTGDATPSADASRAARRRAPPRPDGDEIVRLDGLEVHFPMRRRGSSTRILRRPRGVIRAVDGIDLTLRRGEVLGLVGESGSGKTTTGRVVVKLTRQTAGRISLDGKDVSDLWGTRALRDYRRRVQLIFQDPYETLNPKHTIREFVIEPLLVNGIGTPAERDSRVVAALESAGLRPARDFAGRYPHELSGGQRQRVVIAGALVMGPQVIVADEPVSMLDVSIRTELLRLMLDLRAERGLTYLFITHDLSLAWVIADRIAVMYLGKIMEIGPAEQVIRAPHNPYTQALVSVSPTPEPPTAGRAGEADDPRRRDARCGPRAGRLSLQSALPVCLRSLPRRGAAALRCRGRPVGSLLAGRRRARASGPAATPRFGARVTDEPLPTAVLAELLAASAATIEAEMRALGDDADGTPRRASGARTRCSATSWRRSGAASTDGSGRSLQRPIRPSRAGISLALPPHDATVRGIRPSSSPSSSTSAATASRWLAPWTLPT